eukprot:TRINITY_DN4161_c0_g2_i1.p1 TRINITY_DN4161_c0_g2~~TRINITY_DN4161_c0_g2_i1.p1  ORF type:complete len:208 (-),score=14.92 TRINITY_DN4161_c0_g2_i1:848-1471(-)
MNFFQLQISQISVMVLIVLAVHSQRTANIQDVASNKWGYLNQDDAYDLEQQMKNSITSQQSNDKEGWSFAPEDLIYQPVKYDKGFSLVLPTKLFTKEDYCEVKESQQGVYHCADSQACNNKLMMKLRNIILEDCLTDIFNSKSEGFGDCSCCDKISYFIDRFSAQDFRNCACSQQLLCEELGSLIQLADPFSKFQKCGVVVSEIPTC